MAEAMSEERLERLAGLAELPCTCGDADCGNYTSALTAVEARELVDEVKRLRQESAQLYGHLTAEINISKEATRRLEEATRERDEYRAQLAEIGETREEFGYTETYPNGTVFTEAECDRDCAERAISRTELPAKLIRRLAGEWREVPHA